MAETRGDQVTFEWAGQGGGETAAQAQAAAPGRAAQNQPPTAAPKAPGAPPGGPGAHRTSKVPVPPLTEPAGPPAQPAPLPPDDELWDVHAAARFLKRSVSWVYHRAENGTLPVRRLGGWGLRFIPGELRAWVESGGVAPVRPRE